jgi:hypothetical protein
MQMRINLRGPVVEKPENSPSLSSAGIRSLVVGVVLACLLVGCAPGGRPKPDEPHSTIPLSRDELDRLIVSLANRNEKPTMVQVSSSIASGNNPLFADDYDWDEDRRVWALSHALELYNSEKLWRCLLEHLDDERYTAAYAIDEYARIGSVGGACQSVARSYLQAAYMRHLPPSLYGSEPSMNLLAPERVGPWCHDHAGLLLYRQQAELCEAAVKKMQAMTIPRVPEAEKAQFAADIKRQIDTLLRTEKPVICMQGILPRHEDVKHYSARTAKEIKDNYLAEQNANEQGAK